MNPITDKEFKEWVNMADFIKWNYQGDFKNKVLDRIHNLVCMDNANKLRVV